ncbi:C4-dicarboxylate ABC transporter substrate-binding protein [Acuticoccus sediminis]|uniref:C4-dicarboxylate ABC transporter substrate-binding protein n=1 Tax=Acuticoccus sediminis TaxID=2184697 RepID=A0A8B2NN42_9HYPH|nr:TRAP transporter substrate-binding protein DctP [Acuticoccus sediminis]RAI00031.1 C4-dicarboxylate ABC transporter substrate-binding protein [Acuticoccus sediminis]
MKKSWIAGALAGAMFAGLALPASAATTLRITLQLPMKSHLGQNLLLFKEEVEKLSGGEINVEIYDSAQLYKDNEVPEAVGSGQIEMGVASLTRFVGEIPAVDVFYMPFLFNTEEKVRAAVAPGAPVRTAIDDAIADTGSKVLWWQAYGGAILISNGGPIATPDDIKGKKVRVFGKWLGEWIDTVGGAPTLISGSEQFLAYQRGTVDVGLTGVSGVAARSLWDVMDTITRVNVADIEFIVLINQDFWEGLSEQEQLWINEAATRAETSVRDAMSKIEADAFAKAEENGMTVYDPTPEEIEAWKAASQPVIDKWLSQSGDLGKTVYDAANNL